MLLKPDAWKTLSIALKLDLASMASDLEQILQNMTDVLFRPALQNIRITGQAVQRTVDTSAAGIKFEDQFPLSQPAHGYTPPPAPAPSISDQIYSACPRNMTRKLSKADAE